MFYEKRKPVHDNVFDSLLEHTRLRSTNTECAFAVLICSAVLLEYGYVIFDNTECLRELIIIFSVRVCVCVCFSAVRPGD